MGVRKLLILLLFYSALVYSYSEVKMITLYIGSEKFVVEVADTAAKQQRGLMFRDHIPDDFGMLFVHAGEAYRSFWMKNCLVPLDIIYLDKHKQIINMYIDVPPCKGEPCKSYASARPARYVLELRANRSKELNLKPGDTIFFILNR